MRTKIGLVLSGIAMAVGVYILAFKWGNIIPFGWTLFIAGLVGLALIFDGTDYE